MLETYNGGIHLDHAPRIALVESVLPPIMEDLPAVYEVVYMHGGLHVVGPGPAEAGAETPTPAGETQRERVGYQTIQPTR